MTIADLAARSGFSQAFWYQAIAEGRCPHYRLGKGQGGIRVSEDQYQGFLNSCERRGEEKQPAAVRTRPPALKNLSLS
jgi:hypothetical protein